MWQIKIGTEMKRSGSKKGKWNQKIALQPSLPQNNILFKSSLIMLY
jgi:hypothetical protein